MKKTIILLFLILFACPLLFATLQQGSLVFNGYYNTPVRPVVLSIWDYNNTRLYSTTTSVSNDHLGSSAQEIFHWSLDGDISNGDELEFTFTTFQANVNNFYYRPAYTIEYEIESGDIFSFANGTNLNSSKINVTKDSGASVYSTQYSFKFRSASTGDSSGGQFLMRISDYYGKSNNENIEADFNYRCDVVVTYTSGV